MRRIFCLIPLLLVGVAFGQDDPKPSRISIDRNSFSVGTDTLSLGEHQVELGYAYTDDNDSDADFRSHTFPQATLRIGLRENLEWHVAWGGYTFVHDGGEVASDLVMGFKWIVWEEMQMGLFGELSMPTGHGESDWDPSIRLIKDHSFNDQWSMTANLGVGAPTDEFTGDRFAQGIFSAVVNYAHDEDTTWFAEYYTVFPRVDDGNCEHMLQGGLVYILNDDMAIDFHLGAGLNDDAPDFVAGVGFSYRF